ncbi:uncharacterized protein LOC132903191 [Amyelois transitella]|uniref:uncharacterized protein LOC132903191 n=1 Tax=Amyelois transitella TaxID=680683 RepID=UPI00299010BC|nr:uncharacterized protein LOC132903191 [Amyelois transitella]
MSLETLPLEILGIIARKLDTKSAHNLYEACQHARDAISVPGTIKECQFSLNTLATAQSLRSHFFLDIASNLKVLNLSGVHDLTKTSLKQAVRRLNNLTSLDVSYTNIVLPDYIDIYKMMPALKSLAINYDYGEECYFSQELYYAFQDSFKNLKNLHFVGTAFELLALDVPLWLLSKADLDCLTFTMITKKVELPIPPWGQFKKHDYSILEKISCLKLFFMPALIHDYIYDGTLFDHFDIINNDHVEVLAFQSRMPNLLFATPLLGRFIRKKFQTMVLRLADLKSMRNGDVAFMFWNKKSTRFDDKFFSRLTSVVNDYMPHRFHSGVQRERPSVPSIHKSYLVDQHFLDIKSYEFCEVPLKQREKKNRQALPCFVLNYDEEFKNKEKDIHLEVYFRWPLKRPVPVTINNYDLVKKLTHLTLFGNVLYTPQFFRVLFENAKLETFELTHQRGKFLVSSLLKCMPKCKSLKNFSLNTKISQYGSLYNTLSDCKNLENINLLNPSKAKVDLPNPKYLFSKCENLYSFTFQKDMPERRRAKALTLYERVRSDVGKPALSIRILQYTDYSDSQYSPFYSVFDEFRYIPN